MAQNEELFYDDEDAVKYIRKNLDTTIAGKLTDDDIYYVVDLIYDFYESKGFMSEEDENAEITIADDEIIEYAVSMAKKDSLCKLTPEQIEAVIEGELSYCESIGMFK